MKYIKIRAFTLIELLTVIGIIIVLAALTSGMMSKSKGKAQKVQCINNLKQLHTLTMLFCQENKLPETETLSTNNDTYRNMFYNSIFDYNKDRSLATCPAAHDSQNAIYKIGADAIVHLNSKSSNPDNVSLLFCDVSGVAHGDYWLGILETGKIVQDVKENWLNVSFPSMSVNKGGPPIIPIPLDGE